MKPLHRDDLNRHLLVWIAQVSQATDSLPFLEPCLDLRERERAARFRFPEDRARFVLGRVLLRHVLGHLLGQKPETIELATTELGRPVLAQDDTLQFSISHSHDLVALALTANARVGIDLEWLHPPEDLPELARHIFSDDDLATFQALPASEVTTAFFRAWTRKEAYLKARGEGIAEGLRQISVSFGAEESGSVIDAREKSGAKAWRLLALPLPADYLGTVACDQPDRQMKCVFIRLQEREVVEDSTTGFTS
jgi:4'-phosphopantetheinyl transferase